MIFWNWGPTQQFGTTWQVPIFSQNHFDLYCVLIVDLKNIDCAISSTELQKVHFKRLLTKTKRRNVQEPFDRDKTLFKIFIFGKATVLSKKGGEGTSGRKGKWC